MRDCGRAEVYAAEAAAFDGTDLELVRSFDEVSSVIAAIVEGPWWAGTPVRVVAARRDAASSSAREGAEASTVIRLAADQTTIATAAHELAHALAGPGAGHSPVFLAAYLDVVAVVTNLDSCDRRHRLHVDQLHDALVEAGLVVGARTWPPPPEASSTAIAL
ncbi:MAG TPA: hypothetical protein VMW33_06080 [Ilumatobacteraceae bacterium]|jgi:hypothetical protein|nr:hypothetical protein [Ilumatobacteraceae bacterium]